MITEEHARQFLEAKKAQGVPKEQALQDLQKALSALQTQQTAQPKAQVDNSTLSPADRRFQKEARKRGFLDRAKERGADVMESVEMAREGKQTTAEAGLQIIGKGIGQTIDTGISAITGLGKALLPKKAEEWIATVAKTVNPFSFPGRLRDVTSGQPIGTTNQNLMGAVGEGFQKYEEFSKENPRLSKNLEAGMEIGSVVVPQSRLGKEVTKEALAATKALATSQVGRAAAQVAAAPVKAVGAGYRGAKEVGKFATAKLSGLSRETVDDILQNQTLIKQIEEQGINRDDLFNNVIKAINSKDAELKATGKIYDTVRQSPNTFEVPSVDDIVEGAGIRITDKGLDFSKSRFAAAADVNAIKNIYDDIARAGTMNADELLNLRARVDSLINWKSGTNTPAQLLAKKMRAKVDDVAKKYIPGLAEVDAKYAPLKKFLSQRVRPLVYKSNGDLKDNAVSKIINLVNKGDDKTKLLEQIQPGLTQSIRAIRALEDVALAGGNKVGTYAQNILFASGGLVTGGVPGAVALGVLTNPHVVKNILIKYAQGRNLFKGAVDTITNKVLKGKPLNTKEAAIVSGALDDEVKRVQAERLQIPTRIEAQNRLPVGQSTSAPMTIPQTDKISASTARRSSPAQSIPQEKPISPSVIKTPLDDNVSGKTMQAAQESSTKPAKSATMGDDISKTDMKKAIDSLKARGVSKEQVAQAQDLLDEIIPVGAKINDDGTVRLYHRTTESAKSEIERTGQMTGKEKGIFFSTKKNGQAEGYGDAIVEVDVPIEKVSLDDIFSDEAHLKIELPRPGEKVQVFSPKSPATPTSAPKELIEEAKKYKTAEEFVNAFRNSDKDVENITKYIKEHDIEYSASKVKKKDSPLVPPLSSSKLKSEEELLKMANKLVKDKYPESQDMIYSEQRKLLEKAQRDILNKEFGKFLHSDIQKKLSNQEKEVASIIADVTFINRLPEKGTKSNSIIYKIKDEKLRLAMEKLLGMKSKNIKWGYRDGVLYFDVGGRQASFHMPGIYKNDKGYFFIKTIPKQGGWDLLDVKVPEYTKEWRGEYPGNILSVSDEFADMTMTESQLEALWKQAHNQSK